LHDPLKIQHRAAILQQQQQNGRLTVLLQKTFLKLSGGLQGIKFDLQSQKQNGCLPVVLLLFSNFMKKIAALDLNKIIG